MTNNTTTTVPVISDWVTELDYESVSSEIGQNASPKDYSEIITTFTMNQSTLGWEESLGYKELDWPTALSCWILSIWDQNTERNDGNSQSKEKWLIYVWNWLGGSNQTPSNDCLINEAFCLF